MANIIFGPERKSNRAYVFAGEAALDGSNPTPISTRFRNVTSVSLTLKGSVAPGDNTSVLTYAVTASGGYSTVNVYAWTNTGGTDPTLVASAGTETFSYQIVGN